MHRIYSLNRFNVATSRAKCVCVLVASPSVFEVQCRTPRQMQLANAFARYLELAARLDPISIVSAQSARGGLEEVGLGAGWEKLITGCFSGKLL
jgi:hypothetical protein